MYYIVFLFVFLVFIDPVFDLFLCESAVAVSIDLIDDVFTGFFLEPLLGTFFGPIVHLSQVTSKYAGCNVTLHLPQLSSWCCISPLHEYESFSCFSPLLIMQSREPTP